jgi:sigma-B regulation protein RsbU (phosphoserine phosphatase)
MRVRLVLPLLLMMSFAVAPAVLAQVQPSEDVIALDNWKMHFGDDPQWATPGFDDSGWASSAGPSREPGRSKYQGYRWYRTTINIPDNFLGRDPGLGLGLVEEVYEVYVEGVSVGRFGHWEPQPESPFDRNMCFRVPAGLISGNKVHIAIRRWNGGSNTGYFNFYTSGASRFDHPIEIGLYSTVQSRTELYSATGIVRNLPSNLSLLASLLAGCIAFALYSAQRNRIEYLLLGISCALAALGPFAGSIVAANEHVMRRSMGPVLILLLYAVMQPVSTLFLAQVCPRFRRWLQLGAAIEFLTVNSSAYALATGNSAADAFFWTFVFYPPLILTVLASVGLFQQKNRGSLAIALAVLLRQVAEAWTSLAPHWFHLNDLRFMPLGPFLFDIRNIAQVAMITVILIVLYLRYREEQARALGLEQDMASARRMQEQLLGGSELKVPGFDIHAVYRPSKEVGGDFYRTVPLKDGSLLVVVGDVSGKGLDAAMLVAAVLGTLANETERSPGSLLAYLNQAVLGRTGGGFITACCARAYPDGRVCLANAGHIAPYLDGREIELENGFPLGIATQSTYAETEIRMAGRITLLSDGVVEARNAKGELLGFDRMAALTAKPAAEIADAAQRWGQDDDITVLTLKLSS